MGALQAAPQFRERPLRRIGNGSWNDEGVCLSVRRHGLGPHPHYSPDMAKIAPENVRASASMARLGGFIAARFADGGKHLVIDPAAELFRFWFSGSRDQGIETEFIDCTQILETSRGHIEHVLFSSSSRRSTAWLLGLHPL